MSEVRERAVLPVAIPVGILIGVGLLVVAFAQVLLNVPKEAAVAIALVTAVNLLGVFTVLALRPGLGPVASIGTLVVLGAPLAVGAAAAMGILPVEKEEGHAAEVKPVEIEATNSQFDKKEIHLAAGGEATIKFTNNDQGVPHNVAIVEGSGPGGQQVFQGEIFSGPATKTYTFEAPPAGNYYFFCAVHPNMNGTVVVEEQAAGEGKSAEEPLAVTAKNNSFDKNSLTLPSSGEVTIKFTNADAVPHNMSFFKGSDASGENVFRGEIITSSTKEYSFPAPGPGEYYFQCDVHPNMKGRATSN